MSRPLRRFCVLWSRYGPYHTARLRALRPFLAKRGVELIAIETAAHDSTYAWAPEKQEESGTWATLFPGRHFDVIPSREMEAAVVAALDEVAPDAVAVPSYSTPDSRAALTWARRKRRVAVMMFDSRRTDAERSRWREAVKRTLVRQFDAALVAGTPQREYAVELGLPRSHVFTPLDVVDNERFASGADAAREAAFPEGFLVVSRLTEIKGVHDLLDAYAQYRSRAQTPWPLVVVGDGPERAALEREAPPGVQFAGFVQIGTLPTWYGRARAFVLPTRKDTWGLVVNEAMAAGLPVIVSTGAGCVDDLVDDGRNGFSVPPAEPALLADQLERMASLDDAEREAMGNRSRQIIGGYGLDEFSAGLWNAVCAGQERSDRPLSPTAALALAVLRWLAKSPQSFHAIPD